VATSTLPQCDEQMIRLERHVSDLVTSHMTAEGRKILHRYATWHLLRRLRRRSRGKEVTHYQIKVARQHLRSAVCLLDWLEGQNPTLATCRQTDLERWMTSDTSAFATRQAASRAGPFPRRSSAISASQPRHGTAPPRRWTTKTKPAGETDGVVRIRLGAVPVELPAPVADLALHQVEVRRSHAVLGRPASLWLFPGGQPGRPISAWAMGERLRKLGIRLAKARSIELFQLATELPAGVLARTLGTDMTVAVNW
jgi:hypothetical protein